MCVSHLAQNLNAVNFLSHPPASVGIQVIRESLERNCASDSQHLHTYEDFNYEP